MTGLRPQHIELRRDECLVIEWKDGSRSTLPIAYLRRMSPSADARTLRESMARNPLTVLPAGAPGAPLSAVSAELVGHYALRITFSDGHDTGLYTWEYLRTLADELPAPAPQSPRSPPPAGEPI